MRFPRNQQTTVLRSPGERSRTRSASSGETNVMTPTAKAVGFSGHARVSYRHVESRRLHPSLGAFSSFWLSLPRKCCAAGRGNPRSGAESFIPSRLRTFHRAEGYPPEPPISGCRTGRSPCETARLFYHRKGGARAFPCQAGIPLPVISMVCGFQAHRFIAVRIRGLVVGSKRVSWEFEKDVSDDSDTFILLRQTAVVTRTRRGKPWIA